MGHWREGACNDAEAYLIVYQLGDRLHERLGDPLQGKWCCPKQTQCLAVNVTLEIWTFLGRTLLQADLSTHADKAGVVSPQPHTSKWWVLGVCSLKQGTWVIAVCASKPQLDFYSTKFRQTKSVYRYSLTVSNTYPVHPQAFHLCSDIRDWVGYSWNQSHQLRET